MNSQVLPRHDPKGSTWRIWDLHFHTPASFDYDKKDVDPQRAAEALRAAGVGLVAVTDHHVVDVSFIRELQRLGGADLTVLPGIELRSELGGKETVHYIGIFREDANLDDLWTKLQGLGISSADVAKVGDEAVYVPFVKGCTLIRELGGVVFVHAGRKSNTIEELSNADAVKRAVKADLAHEHIDGFDISRIADAGDYQRIVFPHLKRRFPLMIGSDSHDISRYGARPRTWAKADPTFRGLLQLINEPDTRIYLGDNPPEIQQLDESADKYIDSVEFSRIGTHDPSNVWFSGTQGLNPGLVAVIGKKGAAKSALADVLALLGGSRMASEFSFLNADRFLEPKGRLGERFVARGAWRSGRTVERRLDATVSPAESEAVKYIPQRYLEKICTELSRSNDSSFNRELREVIYSHVGTAERLGQPSMDDLLNYLTNETTQRIAQLMVDLEALNARIVRLEAENSPQHRQRLEADLAERQRALDAHDAARPTDVKPPDADDPATAAASARLEQLDYERATLQHELAELRLRDAQLALRAASAARLLERIENLKLDFDEFRISSEEELGALGIRPEQIATLTINASPIEALRDIAGADRDRIRAQLDSEADGSRAKKLTDVDQAIAAIRKQLDQPSERFRQYQDVLKQWRDRRAELEGKDGIPPESVSAAQQRLTDVGEAGGRLASARDSRDMLLREIFAAKERLLARYRELYQPVQKFIDAEGREMDESLLQFSASMTIDESVDKLLAMIHHGRRGAFHGDKEGRDALQGLVTRAHPNTADGMLEFVHSLEQTLKGEGNGDDRLTDQLRERVTPADIYNFVYGLTYLRPRFELRWQDKTLDQLSPGERGTLLLIFYLLIDKLQTPLIIDQPEENLDNQTITSLLVPAIRAAKGRRQIIMVTHNPNLAVVCDADQVIHCALDRTAGNEVTYMSGAIENPDITKLILDVLEGTKPAFDARRAKYNLLEIA